MIRIGKLKNYKTKISDNFTDGNYIDFVVKADCENLEFNFFVETKISKDILKSFKENTLIDLTEYLYNKNEMKITIVENEETRLGFCDISNIKIIYIKAINSYCITFNFNFYNEYSGNIQIDFKLDEIFYRRYFNIEIVKKYFSRCNSIELFFNYENEKYVFIKYPNKYSFQKCDGSCIEEIYFKNFDELLEGNKIGDKKLKEIFRKFDFLEEPFSCDQLNEIANS